MMESITWFLPHWLNNLAHFLDIEDKIETIKVSDKHATNLELLTDWMQVWINISSAVLTHMKKHSLFGEGQLLTLVEARESVEIERWLLDNADDERRYHASMAVVFTRKHPPRSLSYDFGQARSQGEWEVALELVRQMKDVGEDVIAIIRNLE